MLHGCLQRRQVVPRLGHPFLRIAQRLELFVQRYQFGDLRASDDVDEDGEEVVRPEGPVRPGVLLEEQVGDLLGGGEEGLQAVVGEGFRPHVAEGEDNFVPAAGGDVLHGNAEE